MSGGAVAYLTQSQYGRNKEKITINNYFTSESKPYKTAVTGLAGNSISANSTTSLTSVYAYNTINGMKASTTGNITGIYDLSGGLVEVVSAYILNGNSNINSTGNNGSSGGLMGATSEANPNGYQNLSIRDYTVYPYNISSDDASNNYNTYKGLLTSAYGYGDAVLETSNSGYNTSSTWNYEYTLFAYEHNPFFDRGGYYKDSKYCGLFNFKSTSGGIATYYGFRVILITE